MYSNRYIAFHCCQEKYFDNIKEYGIVKDTKAVFILDLENINEEEIYNTLAVLVYHGIGIDGWRSMLINNRKLDEIDNSLILSIARISKEQEKIINNSLNFNYYRIIENGERTLNYWKIKDIGPIKSLIKTERQKLYKINIVKSRKVDPGKDRFFCKNCYNFSDIDNKEIAIRDIEKICYKIASDNVDNIVKYIFKISNKWMVLI